MALIRPVVPATAALLALLVLFGVAPPETSVTTYAAASDIAAVAGRATGLALTAAGALAFIVARTPQLGVLAMAAALVWSAPDVVGWEEGRPGVRSVAAVAAPFFLPLVAHLVLAFPHGRLRASGERALVGGFYAVTGVVSLGRAIFRDPFEDVHCWSNCTDNVFLVRPERDVVAVLDALWHGAALLAGLALAAVAIVRLARVRRALWPVLVPAVLVGGGEAAYAAALVGTPAEDPQRTGFAAVHLARAGAALALAAGLAWAVLQDRRRRAAVAALSARLGEAPAAGTLATVLARTLRDPSLRVGYWLAAEQRHVDVAGRTLELPPAGGRQATTLITRFGSPVAVVLHDAALLDAPALNREIGAAARLAIDNERLQAAVLAQIADLRASRARIVESADAERRRLERALHDGAQQGLLALSYELRLARAQAADPEADALLGTAVDRADEALVELRHLAHGIYPAILAEAGLAPAVATLADTAPLPVEMGELTRDRHPPAVEATAYLAIGWAIEDATARDATYIGVSAVRHGEDRLRVEARDDGRPRRAATTLHLADRVGALGGRLETGPDALVAELPCG